MASFLNLLGTGLLVLVLTACKPAGPTTHHQVDLGGQRWSLELAVGDEAIRRGLMNRTTIPDGTGMLFLFPRSEVHRFWMANCLIDIDLVFIDGAGHITALHTMRTEPPRGPDESEREYLARIPNYSSRYPVRAAIEIPAGTIRALGLEVGQHTGLDMQKLDRLRDEVSRGRFTREDPLRR